MNFFHKEIAIETPQLVGRGNSSSIFQLDYSRSLSSSSQHLLGIGGTLGNMQTSLDMGVMWFGGSSLISGMLFGGVNIGLLPQFNSFQNGNFGARLRLGGRVDLHFSDDISFGLSYTFDFNTINPIVNNNYWEVIIGF
jgi:hypothetical protein